ncbi:MAG: acyl-CoA dehydrogenase [Thermoprotei archaeon]|nr:MAG: acyl-CoA dehydrogenase [Thermoprotei archaeon]
MFSEAQLMIRNVARRFAEDEVEPIAARIDKEAHIPDEIRRRLAELGFYSTPFPEKYGGAGAGYLALMLVLEEVARSSMAVSLNIGVQFLASSALYLYGSEEQRSRYLPKLLSGELLGCFAFTEASTGSDPEMLETVARKSAQGFVLRGSKQLICNAPLADLAIVFAKDPEVGGLTVFIVEADRPGFERLGEERFMGLRGMRIGGFALNDVEVPEENVLGKRGEGFKMLRRLIAYSKVALSAQAVGVAQSALEEAVKYAKTRMQRGRPIAEFQSIQWLLAEMAMLVEAARSLVYRSAQLMDEGREVIKEAAITKLFAADAAERVTSMAVQVHGSYGYSSEFKVERLYRDAKSIGVTEGSSEIQRVIIASALLR